MNAPIKTLCSSGGPKHKIHSEHGIVFLNRSVKNLNLAALKDRDNQHSEKGCKIEAFNGSIFYASSYVKFRIK